MVPKMDRLKRWEDGGGMARRDCVVMLWRIVKGELSERYLGVRDLKAVRYGQEEMIYIADFDRNDGQRIFFIRMRNTAVIMHLVPSLALAACLFSFLGIRTKHRQCDMV